MMRCGLREECQVEVLIVHLTFLDNVYSGGGVKVVKNVVAFVTWQDARTVLSMILLTVYINMSIVF